MSISASEWQQIQRLVERMTSIIVHGNTAATQIDDSPSTESIDNCPPGNPTIKGRPVVHPYGLASRAKKDTVSVIARVGAHPANKMVIGHRDKNRPALGADGEVVLYDGFGNVVRLKEGKIVVKLQDKLELGEGASKSAARKDDATIANTITDAAFFTFCTGVATFINGLAPGSVTPPASLAGKINAGSSKVTITD